jgi:hypothetical protein
VYSEVIYISYLLCDLTKERGGKQMEVFIGFALVIITLAVGTAIGLKANKNVRTFKEEEHEIFVGREDKI